MSNARKAMNPAGAYKRGYALAPGTARLLTTQPAGTHDIGRPRVLTYVEIHPDGTEYPRTGQVWSECVRVSGMTAYWVRADHDGQQYAVAIAHRRHGVGRVRGSRYRPGRGRVVESGERFTEVHPDAPTGRLTAASRTRVSLPRVIRVEPLDDVTMASLSSPDYYSQ